MIYVARLARGEKNTDWKSNQKGEISLTGSRSFEKTPKDSRGYRAVGCGSV